MSRNQRPPPLFEAVNLQRSNAGIDEPKMRNAVSGVLRHLSHAIETPRGWRDDLADPVGSDVTPRFVRDLGHPLTSPAREIGHWSGTFRRSLWETEAFLKQRQAYLQYTEEDLDHDRRDLDLALPH
jgi:hypothetical protein